MISEQEIKDIHQKSRDQKWSYPQLFNALKEAGVERYETNVLTHEITYVGGGLTIKFPPPAEFQTLTLGSQFDEPLLKKALKRVQAGETNFAEFLAEIAAAGVPYYRVDMRPRTVTYHGQRRIDKLVEMVP